MKVLDVLNYDECENLIKINKAFIKKEEIVDEISLCTYSYRLASYSDFINNRGSRNVRGITFRSDTKELLALPLHKFWNLNENPAVSSEILKNKQILRVTEKYDGSLIYFYLLNGILHAKTKMNCYAEQADWAMNIVKSNSNLESAIVFAINNNYTPIFEFISPRNKIVITYTKEELRFIGMRNMKDGSYNFENIFDVLPVDYFSIDSLESAINKAKNYSGHEGFVVTFSDYDMVKIKTEEYCNLHHLRDNIFNENILANAILHEKLDDIKSVFEHDDNLLSYMINFEKRVVDKYNFIVSSAEKFFNDNRNLIRKDFAIKARKFLGPTEFNLAMNLYVNGKIDEEKFKFKFINEKMWR